MRRLATVSLCAACAGLAVIAASVPAQAASDITETCVDVHIGNDRAAYFDCLNAELKRRAEREQKAPLPAAPVDARSPSNQIGTYNDAAAREHMGNAFGVSSRPQRPTQTFVNPLAPH